MGRAVYGDSLEPQRSLPIPLHDTKRNSDRQCTQEKENTCKRLVSLQQLELSQSQTEAEDYSLS